MSSLRRTEDFHSLKTRGIVYQNPDGTFPPAGSVLAVGTQGACAPSVDLSINSLNIGSITFGGLSGVAGQVLASTGIGSTPSWVNPVPISTYMIITPGITRQILTVSGADTLQIRVFTQAAGGGGGSGYYDLALGINNGGGGGGAGNISDYIFNVPNNTEIAVQNGINGVAIAGNDGTDATDTYVSAIISSQRLSYITGGGKKGTAATSLSKGVGGSGNPPGYNGDDPFGGGGGGFYGGSGGPTENKNGGRGLSVGATSGAGGGGGYGTAAIAAGNGARGFVQIDILRAW